MSSCRLSISFAIALNGTLFLYSRDAIGSHCVYPLPTLSYFDQRVCVCVCVCYSNATVNCGFKVWGRLDNRKVIVCFISETMHVSV